MSEADAARPILVIHAPIDEAFARGYLAPALGGVRILVPASYLQQAQSVIEAYGRGDFELDEHADV